MNRPEYVASINFLTKEKNQRLLPCNASKEHLGLAFTKYFFHKSGVRFEESFNETTLKIEIKCVGTPNKKDLVLFGKLEELIFEFLDKQEVRYD
jgi:hypothetical protein